MSIFVAPFYHASCHILKISMDEIRAARYIDFVYRQSCSCHILLYAMRQNYANFEIAFSDARSEISARTNRRTAIGDTSMCVN